MLRFITALVSTVFLVGLLIWSTNVPDGEEKAKSLWIKRALVQVKPEIYDEYAGTYQLPSGVLFIVKHEDNRLMAGLPPYELLPQTTRRFASNRIIGEIIFDRAESGPAQRVNIRAAKQDMWAQRVNPADIVDPTQMVDAGGHRLRMLVTGSGGPTIVIEDGFGSSIRMRSKFHAELSKFARVVTYDHAGTGGSEAGPSPRPAGCPRVTNGVTKCKNRPAVRNGRWVHRRRLHFRLCAHVSPSHSTPSARAVFYGVARRLLRLAGNDQLNRD